MTMLAQTAYKRALPCLAFSRSSSSALKLPRLSTSIHTSSPASCSTHFNKTMSVLQGTTIPTTQTACVVPKIGAAIEVRDQHPVKQAKDLAPGECLVKLSHTGVCHTDLHAKKGDWPVPPMNPLIGMSNMIS